MSCSPCSASPASASRTPLAFLGYAVYLLFFFEGGEVRIFFYAFIVPIFAVIQIFKARKARREEQQQMVMAPESAPAAQQQ